MHDRDTQGVLNMPCFLILVTENYNGNSVHRALHTAGAQQILNNTLHYSLFCLVFSQELKPNCLKPSL